MNKLTKQAEQRLLNCVSDAISLVNDGLDPTDAIIKVARSSDLNRPMTQRVLEAYNQSKTLHELAEKKGSSRLGEFAIVNSDSVMKELFPNKAQTKAEEKRAMVALTAIAGKVPNYIEKLSSHRREQESSQLVKEAAVIDRTPKFLAEKPAFNFKVYNRELNEQIKMRKEAEYSYIEEKEGFLKLATDLADSLRSMFFYTPFHVFEAAFTKEHGTENPELVKLAWDISNAANLGQRRMTSADFGQISSDLTMADILGPSMYGSVESLVKSATNLHKKAQDLKKKLAQYNEKSALFDATSEALSFAKNKFNEAGQTDQSQYNSALGDAVTGLTDPRFRDRLEQIRIQSMLHDFANNDEVISKYPIEQVAELFNQLQDVAPRAASKPAVMKDMLRRGLVNGGSEALEIGQLASLNKDLGNDQSDMNKTYQALMTGPSDITNKLNAEALKARSKPEVANKSITGDTGIMGSLKNLTSPLSSIKTEVSWGGNSDKGGM